MKLILFFIPLITFGSYRQTETIKEYLWDFSVSGGVSQTNIDISTATTGTSTLPLNTIVKEVDMRVLTQVTSSTNSSITFGNSISSSGYFSALAVSDLVTGVTKAGNGGLIFDNTNKIRISYPVSGANDRDVIFRVSEGQSLTAGKILFLIKFYTWGRDD